MILGKFCVVEALGGKWWCLAQTMACWLVKYHRLVGMWRVCICVCVLGGRGGGGKWGVGEGCYLTQA